MTDHKFTDEEVIKALECCFLSSKAIKSLIAEAIKEFAERLKECAYDLRHYDGERVSIVEAHCIDRIAK